MLDGLKNNILSNKANSQNMSSAKKKAEESRINMMGEGRRLHKSLMSSSGFERAQAIAEICKMIFSS